MPLDTREPGPDLPGSPKLSHPSPTSGGGRHAGKHALIVEDRPLDAEVLAVLLALSGVDSTHVSTARRLAEVLAELNQLDVLFLDLQLPDADGFEVLRRLRNDPALAGVPIVAYSAYDNEMDRARREGFHSFLAKPLRQERFAGHLDRILHNQAVWDN